MTNLVPEHDRFRFFVYIVESPSAIDLYHNRVESGVIQQAVRLNRLKCISRLAVNLQAFEASLKIGLTEAMEATQDSVPLVHISAHGFSDGIQLTSGEIVDWSSLKELLTPINRALRGNLIVCMSTCEGYSGSRMAMISEPSDFPFFALVGNGSKPTWSETAVGFSTFYHLLANNRFVEDAVDAMRIASGNANFYITTAEESRQSYLDFVAKLDASEAREELQEVIHASSEDDVGKFLTKQSDDG